MKLIIAGSRDIDKYYAFWEVVKATYISDGEIYFASSNKDGTPGVPLDEIKEFVTGMAEGPDQVPFLINEAFFLGSDKFPIKEFRADWKKYGKIAGPMRNAEMAEYADAAVVIMWKGGSSGSKDMIRQMRVRNKPVHVIEV